MDNPTFHQFLQSVLVEVAIDDRVPTGMIDFGNNEHLQIFAEKLAHRGIERRLVVETVNKLALQDGKHPDRQAYNKDGWLVTFPTPAHKDAAIKKKTHFGSDPTHGQGGMNLYYKSKGKQARQQSQGSSEVGGDDEQQPPDQKAPATEPSQLPAAGNGEADKQTQPADSSAPAGEKSTEPAAPDNDASALPPSASDAQSAPNAGSAPAEPSNASTTSTGNNTSAPAVPDAPTGSSIVQLTVEFAKSKGWKDAPYGDWTDDHGEQVAVTGLDGQVVPVKYVNREELKTFAEKRMVEGIVLREAFQRLRYR